MIDDEEEEDEEEEEDDDDDDYVSARGRTTSRRKPTARAEKEITIVDDDDAQSPSKDRLATQVKAHALQSRRALGPCTSCSSASHCACTDALSISFASSLACPSVSSLIPYRHCQLKLSGGKK